MIRQVKPDFKKTLMLCVLIAVVLALLMGIEYTVISKSYRDQARRTASLLIDQVEGIIENNQKKTQALEESLKENYIARARAVAYIIDQMPDTIQNTEELAHIAGLMSIDEIHLFDESGTIIAGSVQEYIGLTVDSGEQIGFFKPMIEDRSLSMCQDVTPNTAEGKPMMYAICWNQAGDTMVQVGIEPVRLLEELRTDELSETIAAMPTANGIEIIVADRDTEAILGATQRSLMGQTLSQIGIQVDKAALSQPVSLFAAIDSRDCFCTVQARSNGIIVIAEDKAVLYRSLPIIMATVFLYLLLAAAAIGFVHHTMNRRILNEFNNANTDMLTGLLNRRAYEAALARHASDPDRETFTYISLDLNGLKLVNDTMGHDAGDELLRTAADHIKACYGEYGALYRIGGDEFVALLYLDEAQLRQAQARFSRDMAKYTGRLGAELSISSGCIRADDYPGLSLNALSRLADNLMYAEKDRYYRLHGDDRRRR